MSNGNNVSYNNLMLSDQIKTIISGALIALNLPDVSFSLEHPSEESFGDYATNVAMVLFPILKKQGDSTLTNPRDLAQAISNKIVVSDIVLSVSVAGPGFINFSLQPAVFTNTLQQIIAEKDNFGKSTQFAGKKIVVEYTDPNPFKEFHIGHLYSNIVGETIARIFETNGATVWRADYFGDVGMHVAKSIWGLLKKFRDEQQNLENLSTLPLTDRVKYLGQSYALGATSYEEDETAKDQIKNLNAALYEVSQQFIAKTFGKAPTISYPKPTDTSYFQGEDLYTIYATCRQWSLDYFETIYQRLGTKFDGYYPESMVGEYGYQLVKSHQDIFEVGEGGAIIFPGKKYGLHDRVFINSLGLPTYECKELGLVPAKYKDFPYDKSIIVTGNEINDYFNVLLKAMELVEPTLGKITTHIGHGMVRLPEGKMSSRTGKVTTGTSLLADAKAASLDIINEQNPELPDKETVSDLVGIAAIRYAFLKTSIGKDVIFDFKESISFNGDAGPYLQYTYTRCSSVLVKAGEYVPATAGNDLTSQEIAVMKWLTRYPETIIAAATELTPHVLCEYVYELAQRFNAFYHQCPIMGNEYRLTLTESVRQVLKNALSILGIDCPERM